LAFELHAGELGILTGTSIYIMAFSGILFGALADKVSRTKLMAFVELIYGIGLLFNGFTLMVNCYNMGKKRCK
jgi:MFS family permease